MTGAITEAPLWWNKTERSEEPGLCRQMEGQTVLKKRGVDSLHGLSTSTYTYELYLKLKWRRKLNHLLIQLVRPVE